jgi:capsular exopolysaccharide synthesis family protein
MSVQGNAAASEPTAGIQYEFSPELVTLVDHRPEETEAIRTVRTHIIARHIKDGRRGLAICAATPGVGCTFTATNLAVSLAQVGVATLLIDGNMREPSLERLVRPGNAATSGLKQCITEEGGYAGALIHPEVIPNLSLLYAGGVADNAQELLAGDAFRTLIERCLRDFEFTIIDTPPASICADARRIGTMVGYALIVARAHASRMADVSNLAGQLQEDGAQVVGTVLNEI